MKGVPIMNDVINAAINAMQRKLSVWMTEGAVLFFHLVLTRMDDQGESLGFGHLLMRRTM
jgi:hypothetical protein